jgi:hypothetical protein
MNPKLEVRESSLGGRGVFTCEKITVGELLAVFGGCVMPASDEIGDWSIQVDENLVIGHPPGTDAADDPSNYFNHSCNPNAGIKGQIMLAAMRTIDGGEEITFDYAMVLSPSVGCLPYRIDCNCGSSDCRGLVTDDDWRLPDLQRRYKGWFSWYLQMKIIHR